MGIVIRDAVRVNRDQRPSRAGGRCRAGT